MTEDEFERLALKAMTDAQIDALVKRCREENEWAEPMTRTSIMLVQREARGEPAPY